MSTKNRTRRTTTRNIRFPNQMIEQINIALDQKGSGNFSAWVIEACRRRLCSEKRVSFGNRETGAAWLSSARVVKCWVKSRNERNPYPLLPAVQPGTQRRLPVINWRKVGMTSSHHGPYDQGYTRATMAHNADKVSRKKKMAT